MLSFTILASTALVLAAASKATTQTVRSEDVEAGSQDNPLLLLFSHDPDVTYVDATPDEDFFADRLDDNVVVVSSWLLFHMIGAHIDELKPPRLPHLVSGVRDAIADAIEVCRPAVGIIDMRAVNFGSTEPAEWLATSKHRPATTMLEEAMPSIIRSRSTQVAMPKHNTHLSYLNVTQVRVVYEVRIFEKMHMTDSEVARRIDKFQIYSHFADLSRLLTRSMSKADPKSAPSLDIASLDDTGYAARHAVSRRPLSDVDLSICAAEWELQDARRLHQYVMALAFLLLVLTTCAGSAVFTLKYATATPSRWNPLIPPSD